MDNLFITIRETPTLQTATVWQATKDGYCIVKTFASSVKQALNRAEHFIKINQI